MVTRCRSFMLTQLQLRDFRCFGSLSVPLRAGFNFFVGANSEGKTTILEAACMLLRLQSQRTATLAAIGQTMTSRLEPGLGPRPAQTSARRPDRDDGIGEQPASSQLVGVSAKQRGSTQCGERHRAGGR